MRFLLQVLILLLPFVALAQPSAQLSSLKTVERIELPQLNNEQLLQEELERRGPGIAPRFAETLEVDLQPDRAGTWEYTQEGLAIWRLRIHSPGAQSLNLGFTEYSMPEGGKLFLYNPDKKHVMGPFTPSDNEVHDQLWTPVLPGDELVLELQLPPARSNELRLRLQYINHDFLGFGNPEAVASGSCNLDVICGAMNGWDMVDDYRDIIQSVAVIGINGNTFCTGFLINNANQDCTPYFMTAFHCGVNQNNAASLVAYWNYQNSFCRQPNTPQSGQPGNGVLNDFNTGSFWRAGWSPSDFTLVEFDEPVSATAEAFFAGWSAADVPPSSSIAVHHPNTEEKRISFEEAPSIFTTYLNDSPVPNYTHVRVADWDVGTTEGGSSGSPLFNQNKHVVGQLHGGFASCSSATPDWYGSFAISWNGGGTNTTRLRNWLDPDNTGVLTLDGRHQQACSFFVDITPPQLDACLPATQQFTLEVGEAFEGMVILSLEGLPPDATVVFSSNPVAPGATLTMTLTLPVTIASGAYTASLLATDGSNEFSGEIAMNLANAVPNAPNLNAPANGSTGLGSTPTLQWVAASGASGYQVQVSTAPNFSSTVFTATGIDGTSINTSALNGGTTYYWRVRASNFCGQSAEWSTVYNFTTGIFDCIVYPSSNVPVTISSQGTPTVTSTLVVDQAGIITDVNVLDLIGTHTWVSDLIFSITSPEGTTVVLISEACDDEDNFNISFDDDAPNANYPCPYNDGETYLPAQPLAAFNGEDMQGTWTLTVQDVADQDGGQVQGWSLEICAVPSASVSLNPNALTLCPGSTLPFDVSASNGFSEPATITVSGLPPDANVALSNPTINPGDVQEGAFNAGNNTPAGNYMLTVQVQNAEHSASATLNVTVLPKLQTPPQISQPSNGETGVLLNPLMNWQALNGADSYTVLVSLNPDMSNPLFNSGSINNTSYIVPSALEQNTTYYWQVTASNACGEVSSNIASFTTTTTIGTINVWNEHELLLSPNPTDGLLQLSFTQPLQEQILLELLSVNGISLQSHTLSVGMLQQTLDLEYLPAGVYLLRIQTARGIGVRKIVRQ